MAQRSRKGGREAEPVEEPSKVVAELGGEGRRQRAVSWVAGERVRSYRKSKAAGCDLAGKGKAASTA